MTHGIYELQSSLEKQEKILNQHTDAINNLNRIVKIVALKTAAIENLERNINIILSQSRQLVKEVSLLSSRCAAYQCEKIDEKNGNPH
jgi:hypothetical protein